MPIQPIDPNGGGTGAGAGFNSGTGGGGSTGNNGPSILGSLGAGGGLLPEYHRYQ